MVNTSNLERLKSAYTLWHDNKGSDGDIWLDLMSDNVQFRSMGGAEPVLAFASHRSNKAEAAAYFAGLTKDWTMVHWTPETFVNEGNRIAVFSTCAWTHKATGKLAEIAISHLWIFENDKALAVTEIFDSARAIAAATA